jgi:ribosomal protein L11 methyltransferase
VVRVETDVGFAEVLEAGFALLGLNLVSWHNLDSGRVTFEEFFASRRDAESRRRELRQAITAWAEGEPWSLDVHALPAEDWSTYWRRFFHAERISPRVVVKPSWEPWDAQPGDCIVEIDPGMSFGTGQHPTTRACLRVLDALAAELPGSSFLDVGCGSGILSIAAAKLGFCPVVAIDNDADAVRIAEENIRRNGVANRVDCHVGDLETLRMSRRFETVAANLFAHTLELFAVRIGGLVARGARGRLILAGMLDSQYESVLSRYAARGFAEIERIPEQEWISGCFRRAAAVRSVRGRRAARRSGANGCGMRSSGPKLVDSVRDRVFTADWVEGRGETR